MQRLQGRTALVTGATSGIGRAVAEAFAAEGARVAVGGRDAARGAAVVDAIRAAGGVADFVAGDLGGGAEAAGALARDATAALGGRVDVLVNNAGIYPGGPTAEIDEATFDRVQALNVKGTFFLTAALAPAMAARGSGAIVTVGSWIAALGLANTALYASSKGAVEVMTRAWAAEYGPSGVRVNAVAPGVTAVREDAEVPAAAAAYLRRLVAGIPARRLGRPEEIAAAVVFLASEEASYVQGVVLPVDGGQVTVRAAV